MGSGNYSGSCGSPLQNSRRSTSRSPNSIRCCSRSGRTGLTAHERSGRSSGCCFFTQERARSIGGSAATTAGDNMHHGTTEGGGGGGPTAAAAAAVSTLSEVAEAAAGASACTCAEETEGNAAAAAEVDKDSSVAAVLERAEQALAKGKLLLFVVHLKEKKTEREQQQVQQLQDFREQQSEEQEHQQQFPEPQGHPQQSQRQPQQQDALEVNPQLQHAAGCPAGGGSTGWEEEAPVDIEDITHYLDPPSPPPAIQIADSGALLHALHSPRRRRRSSSSSCHSNVASSGRSCHDRNGRRRSLHSSSGTESSDCWSISSSSSSSNSGSSESGSRHAVFEDACSSSYYSFSYSSSLEKSDAAASGARVSHLRPQHAEVREEQKERQKQKEDDEVTSAAAAESHVWVPLQAKPLPSVTDFSAQLWCEQQLQYTLQTGRRRETVAMRKGTARHLALELLHHDLETVYVDTEEEMVAFKLLNTIRQLQQLRQRGVCREVWIFGFVQGVGVRGVIDELRVCSPFYSPFSPSPPSALQSRLPAAASAASVGSVAASASVTASTDAKEANQEDEPAEAAARHVRRQRGKETEGWKGHDIRRQRGGGRGAAVVATPARAATAPAATGVHDSKGQAGEGGGILDNKRETRAASCFPFHHGSQQHEERSCGWAVGGAARFRRTAAAAFSAEFAAAAAAPDSASLASQEERGGAAAGAATGATAPRPAVGRGAGAAAAGSGRRTIAAAAATGTAGGNHTIAAAAAAAEEELYVLLSDNKTRSVKNAPPMAQKRSSALQLQVYWHLLQQLRDTEIPLQALLDAFGLQAQTRIQNPLLLAVCSRAAVDFPRLQHRDTTTDCRDATTAGAAAVGRATAASAVAVHPATAQEARAGDGAAPDTAAAAEAEAEKTALGERENEGLLSHYEGEVQAAELLRRLLLKLQEELQRLPPLWKDVHIVYECDGEEFLREEIPCHTASLLHSLDDMLGWWKGRRPAEPVQPMEKWKCRSCIFLKDCSASPLDVQQREAALAAQEEALEAEKRALEEFEETVAANASAGALQAERLQQAQQKHVQQLQQQQCESKHQGEQLLLKQQGQQQTERELWSSMRALANPAGQALLQREKTGAVEQNSRHIRSLLSCFLRDQQSSSRYTQSFKQVKAEQQQLLQKGTMAQRQQAGQQQGCHAVQRNGQQWDQASPQRKQQQQRPEEEQNKQLHKFPFFSAAEAPAGKLAGRSAAPVTPSPAASSPAASSDHSGSGDAFSSSRTNTPRKGAGLSFSPATTQVTRGVGVAHGVYAAAPGAGDEETCQATMRMMHAAAASTATSYKGHEPGTIAPERVLQLSSRTTCSTVFDAVTTSECPVSRDARHKFVERDVPSGAFPLENRVGGERKCAPGYSRSSRRTARKHTTVDLMDLYAAVVASADTKVNSTDTQSPLVAQKKMPTAAARLPQQEKAPPAASATPPPLNDARLSANPSVALAFLAGATNARASAGNPTLPTAAAVASRDTVLGNSQTQLAGSNGSSRERVSDAAGPLAGADNSEEAGLIAAAGTPVGAEEAAEGRNTHTHPLTTACIDKHERRGGVLPTGSLSHTLLRAKITTSCRSTVNTNGRSSSQTSLGSLCAPSVTPAKRSRSLVAGGATGVAAGEIQFATLKSRQGHAGSLKGQLASSHQLQVAPTGQKQVPRKTSTFRVASSKHQTQIIRYFTTERPAS